MLALEMVRSILILVLDPNDSIHLAWGGKFFGFYFLIPCSDRELEVHSIIYHVSSSSRCAQTAHPLPGVRERQEQK